MRNSQKVFISVMFLLVAICPQARCITPERLDSLVGSLKRRQMPEYLVFLPCAMADVNMDDAREEGIWQVPLIDIVGSRGSEEECALDRLQELFEEYASWEKAVVAYVTSPTAVARMSDSEILDAPILKSLENAGMEYSDDITGSFDVIEARMARRKAEREEALRVRAARDLQAVRDVQRERTTYRIKSGDTLGGIALKYRVKVSDLKKWNNLKSDMIREGRTLVIYKR